MDNDRPVKTDWLATDPEHAFVFCRGKCHFYTYVTARPLRLAYFDGSSAGKVNPSGAMDTQDIVIWGKVRPDMIWEELLRLQELCKWGEQFKLDGFVRYLFDCFLHLAFSLTVFFLQDGNELVSVTHLIDHQGWLIYDPVQRNHAM